MDPAAYDFLSHQRPSSGIKAASETYDGSSLWPELPDQKSLRRTPMRFRLIAILAVVALIFTVGCSKQRANNPSVKSNVEDSLKQAGFDKVNVDEDRDKGVITIKGDVATQADKQRAEEVARQSAGNNVISNELLVTAGDEDRAEKVADKSDDAIGSSFKAYLAENKLENQHIRSDVKNGV